MTGFAQTLGKLALDAMIQRDVEEDVRTSAFARSETWLQMAWVSGGALGIALPLRGDVGFGIASGAMIVLTAMVVQGAANARKTKRPAGSPSRPGPARPADGAHRADAHAADAHRADAHPAAGRPAGHPTDHADEAPPPDPFTKPYQDQHQRETRPPEPSAQPAEAGAERTRPVHARPARGPLHPGFQQDGHARPAGAPVPPDAVPPDAVPAGGVAASARRGRGRRSRRAPLALPAPFSPNGGNGNGSPSI